MSQMRWTAVIGLATAVVFGGVAYAGLQNGSEPISGCVGARGVLRVVDSGVACEPGETAIDWNRTGPQGPAGAQGARGEPGVSATGDGAARVAPQTPGLTAAVPKPGVELAAKLSTPKAQAVDVVTRSADKISVPASPPASPSPFPAGSIASDVGTVALPKGKWVIWATLLAARRAEPQGFPFADLPVECVLLSGGVEAHLGYAVKGALTWTPMSTHMVRALGAPGLVKLRCSNGQVGASLRSVRITAIRAGTVDAGPLGK